MAFITINHHAPADNGAAFVAENATLAGSVRLEKNSSVWYGAVLRADTGRIAIGESPSDTGPLCTAARWATAA